MVIAGSVAADDGFLQKSFGDFKEELSLAKSKKKKAVFLFFEQDECPFCHRMKHTIFNQPRVQKYFKDNFLIYSVDIEQTEDITDFQGRKTTQKKFFETVGRHRGGTPVMAFFDLKGKLITRFVGATSSAEEFLLLGKYVAEGHYKKMPFTRFKRKHRKTL
jgi:thioredoxin-related protein